MRPNTVLFSLAAFTLISCAPAPDRTNAPDNTQPQGNISPLSEILVLGDSQISFGAGDAYRRFFANLDTNCPSLGLDRAPASTAAVGVRSSSLQNWTATDGPARGVICDVDSKYGVNAGAYGVTSPQRSYVQIGKDPAYPFCQPDKSPLQAVFDAPDYDPDLVVLAFLGNSFQRWQSADNTRVDWQAARALIPDDKACVVMSTIPAFKPEDNRLSLVAQTNLGNAVRADGRCAFVAGLTPETLEEFEGNKTHFRLREDGTVRDPRHPSEASAARFTQLQTPALCAAVGRAVLQ
ncbi:SGNH/GDSL hydrolase family protein [Sulfitobacter sp.]|uniref:SGNH/GDSL hydrolase family protein n=1 Tax=Sulfitobacter sp. TaxID=1903071 RepID=UPI003296D3DA